MALLGVSLNGGAGIQVTVLDTLLVPKATPFPLRETTTQKISADDVHSTNNTVYGVRFMYPHRVSLRQAQEG